MKTRLFFALLFASSNAYPQVDPLGPTQQVYYAMTLSDAVAKSGLHRGMKVMVATNGLSPRVRYDVIDAGSLTVSSPHIVNCTGSSCQLVEDGYMVVDGSLVLSKLPTGTTNYVVTNKGSGNVWAPVDDAIHGSRGGGTLHATATLVAPGFMPAFGSTDGFAHTNGTGGFDWAASISPSFLTVGAANYVLSSNGSVDSWSAMTDAIHGSRGGGSLHALANGSSAGFLSALAPGFLNSNGTTTSWITQIQWSTLTSLPTITTTLPLTGGGTCCSLTLGINAATTSTAGSMSASDKLKLDGIPNATTANFGLVLTPAVNLAGQYVLISPTNLGYIKGSGTQNHLARYTTTGTALVDSAIIDDDSSVSTTLPLTVPKLAIIGAFTTGNDTIPALGSTAGRANKFTLLNDGGLGNYGLIGGVLGNGDVFLQAQRVDGTAQAFNIQLQPNGGATGFGVTDPTASVDIGNSLRIRGGSPAVGSVWTATDTAGNGAWQQVNPKVVQGSANYRAFEWTVMGATQLLSATPVTLASFTETDLGAAGDLYHVAYYQATAFIELEVVTRLYDSGTCHPISTTATRQVWVAELNKVRLGNGANEWQLAHDFEEHSSLNYGDANIHTTQLETLFMANLTNSTTGATTVTARFPDTSGCDFSTTALPGASYKIRVFGNGHYN
jgi:hypothetical protein